MGRFRLRGRDWVKSIFLDSNVDPGSTKDVDPGTFTFTFMHLADAFIQSDLHCIQAIRCLSVCVFPGN